MDPVSAGPVLPAASVAAMVKASAAMTRTEAFSGSSRRDTNSSPSVSYITVPFRYEVLVASMGSEIVVKTCGYVTG